MDKLFNLYSKKVVRGSDEFEMFQTFFNGDRKRAEQWLDSHMKTLQTKNDKKADQLRIQGNKFYMKKNFKESIETYTKALCNAEHEKETYSVILSNRSAAFYMTNDFKNCLKDINYCIKCNCPENILLKIYIRRVKCYAKMDLKEQLNNAVMEALEFADRCPGVTDKDLVRKDIFTSSIEKAQVDQMKYESIEGLPKLKDSNNNSFLYASSAIRLDYDEQRGRYVKANKKLNSGDIIFIEKPLIFAPVFINEYMDLPFDKCYNCLKTTLSCIPCQSCIRCVFCDEDCRDNCWDEFHKWECVGMQADLWYNIGIAFPAFRALLKGAKSGFNTLDTDYKTDTVCFGNKCNNYPYFNKLVSNISKMKNILPFIISATVIILYLKKKTEFFNWLTEQPKFLEENVDDLIIHLGGLLTRHIAQFQCNSSTIFHKNLNSYDDTPVACAIYPSVSMMNHSCKPNIAIYYIRDIVIVEAAEEIKTNEEICNCYGIDYRYDDWKSRQEHLRNQYYFDCRCRACKEHFEDK
ncbi:hypothetical protein ILUMI_00047 [Ignelater luminosus]|uniref:Protein-lysine N-methyltransferase SMYD4 n=1 Tax=Ignelater luminosus TaxID=2038154 RepID=A0A8K0DL02_IGNLU|nr:hypothetical protein ILUMI_00047 [Ignelater luminosus]